MANFIERTLEKGEKVVFVGRLHWIYNWKFTFGGIALMLLFLLFLIADYWTSTDESGDSSMAVPLVCLVGILVGAALVGWGYFIRSKTEFAITNNRFIQKDGIFNIKMTEIPLFKVETVNFYQSFTERILNTGTIELVGSGGTSHKLSYVQQPFKVRNLLTTYMKESKGKE